MTECANQTMDNCKLVFDHEVACGYCLTCIYNLQGNKSMYFLKTGSLKKYAPYVCD